MSDLSEHMAFTVRITHFDVSGVLWERIFSTLLPGHCFSKLFLDFLNYGCQEGTQNVVPFRGENVLKTTPSPKSSPGTPRRAQEHPNDAKVPPKAPKNDAPGDPKTVFLALQQWLLALS